MNASGNVGSAIFTINDRHYGGGGIQAELRTAEGAQYKSFAAAGMFDTLGSCTLTPACCESSTTKYQENCRLTGEQVVRLYRWDDSQMLDGGPGGSLVVDGGYVELNLSY